MFASNSKILQHLENAQLRGREQAATWRERCNWLEARVGEMEVQILQEVENHKRMCKFKAVHEL